MIAVYDTDTMERKCNIMYVKSVKWVKRFFDVGSFTIKFSTNTKYQEHLKMFNIISHNENYGIILNISQDKDLIEISGYDLKGLCKFRQVIPPFVYSEKPTTIQGYDRISGNAETVIKHYIDKHMVNPLGTEDNVDRKINRFIIASNQNRGVNMVWQAKFTQLSEEIRKICIFANMGYDITFSSANKQLIFDVYTGVDRTVNQSITPAVVISYNLKNCNGIKYNNDYLSAKNTIYTSGSGEEELQYIEKVADSRISGIRRMEGFKSAGNIDVTEVKAQGELALKENAHKETIEAETVRIKYRKDYFLGDFITVKANITGCDMVINKQVTEVEEFYERGSYTATPVLGDKKEFVIKKLLRSVN